MQQARTHATNNTLGGTDYRCPSNEDNAGNAVRLCLTVRIPRKSVPTTVAVLWACARYHSTHSMRTAQDARAGGSIFAEARACCLRIAFESSLHRGAQMCWYAAVRDGQERVQPRQRRLHGVY